MEVERKIKRALQHLPEEEDALRNRERVLSARGRRRAVP